MFERLGSLTFRFRYLMVAAWVVVAVVCVALAPSLASEGSADQAAFLPPTSPSVVAKDALEEAFPGSTSATSATITFSRDGGLTDGDRTYLAEVDAWVTGPDAPPELSAVVSGTESATSRPELESMLRSEDGELELLVVNLDVAMAGGEAETVVSALREHLASTAPDGVTAHVTGAAGISSDYMTAIEAGTDSSTAVTVALVLVILLLIYRAPLAALVPLVTIGAAFVVARGTLGFLAAAGWEVSSLLDTFLVVLVFGVGTDYAIFLISRFREEVSREGDWHAASSATVGRIGAVISASAATVMVGLGAMAFGDFRMIQSTGPALAVAIFVTLIAGLTLAPAMLAIFGHYLFWPRHMRQAPEGEPGGFFARLADLVSKRPGLVTAALLVGLAIPAMFVPQMKTNFDILSELPGDSDARLGYEEIAAHLGEDKLVQSTGIVDAGPSGDMLAPAALARTRDLMADLQATPGVATVTSLVTPEGDGVVPDGFRPSIQLATIADDLDGDADPEAADGTGTSALLDPEVDEGLAAALDYVEAVGAAYPDVAGQSELRATTGAIEDAQALIDRIREQSVLSTQLRSLADAVTSPTSAAGDDGSAGIMSDYLVELAAAWPEVRDLSAYGDATKAAAALERETTIQAALDLSVAFDALAVHFDGRTDATFSPESLADTDAARELRLEATRTFDALPVAFRDLASEFEGRSDDIFIPVGLGGEDGEQLDDAVDAFVSADRTATRFYLTATADPYSGDAFGSVDTAQAVLATAAPGFGPSAGAYLGGPTAQFLDVQDVLSADFQRVGVVTVIGILLVLIVLLRAIVAPLYLVGTVLLSYASAVGLSSWFFQEVLGQPGVSFYLPLMVFVLLVALGSDYNIFLMSRVREESETRPIRDGIRIASGHTGAVITSAGLILAGTFGSMATAPLVVLFQVGVAVALGVLIDTFLVRSILVPAITTLAGDRAWWPSGGAFRGAWAWLPAPAPAPIGAEPAAVAAVEAAGSGTRQGVPVSRRLAVVLAMVVVVPAVLAGLLTWSLADPASTIGSLPAAVVDEDETALMTGADGSTAEVRLGGQLAAALEDDSATGSFDWMATDATDATAGLSDGRYAAVLTIPSDFSARVAAIRRDRNGQATPATLRLVTNDGSSEGVATVARDVTAAIAASTGQPITDAYVDDVLLAVSAAHDGVVGGATEAREVADGSTGLAGDAAGIGAVADSLVAGLEELVAGAAEAGDGTNQLAAGTSRLATGTRSLATGATNLADGTESAAEGAADLASGAGAVAEGMAQLDGSTSGLPAQVHALAQGAADVSVGAAGVAGGSGDLAKGLETMAAQTAGLGDQAVALDAGARDLASGAASLADGADEAAAGAAKLAGVAGDLATAVGDYTSAVTGLAAACEAQLGAGDPLCAQLNGLAATNGQLTGAAGDVASSAAGVAGAATAVAGGASETASGAAALAAGTGQLADAAPALEAGIAASAAGAASLASGAGALAAGSSALADGAAQLDAATPELAGAISDLSRGAAGVATGNKELARGLDDLATGADALEDGARLTASAAAALASGTAEAADGVGLLLDAMDQATDAARLVGANADQVADAGGALADDADALADGLDSSAATMPGYTEEARSGIAALAAAPVTVEASAGSGGAALNGGLAPVFLAIALWVGALAIFLVLPARWWTTGPRGWRGALAVFGGWALLGLAQAILAVLLLQLGLGIRVANPPALLLSGVLAAVTFAAIVQAFVALGGRRGWLLALLFLGLQVAAVGIPYPLESMPLPLAVLHPLLPLSWAVDAMRTAIAGGGVALPLAATALLVWLVGALLVTLSVAASDRRAGPMVQAPAA